MTRPAMSHKERMLAAIRGEPVDTVPWVPRLDLWYNAHKRAGTLPGEYREATLKEITEDLGFGYHAVVPNFKDLKVAEDDIHRALGIYNLWNMPYRTVLQNVRVTPSYERDNTTVLYDTPAGSIETRVLYNERMRKDGITITHILDYAIKKPADYKTVGYIFDNARVEPNFEGYSAFSKQVGDQGLAVAFTSLAGSPMHLLQRELMSMERFFYDLHDYPEELAACAESIGRYFELVFGVAADSPAEVVMFGANYDATVTYPPFFREQILPWLKRFANRLHSRGKYLLTHTDGENRGLLDLYLESDIDVADSICPKPMTSLSFQEVRRHFHGQITIMGGIPSVCLLRESMPDQAFEAYIDSFFAGLESTDHLILGISDTTPPAADFSRLKRIARYAADIRC